jgi:hypothetical protein
MKNQNRPIETDRPRTTVIPAPRDAALFPGWGVKF